MIFPFWHKLNKNSFNFSYKNKNIQIIYFSNKSNYYKDSSKTYKTIVFSKNKVYIHYYHRSIV